MTCLLSDVYFFTFLLSIIYYFFYLAFQTFQIDLMCFAMAQQQWFFSVEKNSNLKRPIKFLYLRQVFKRQFI